ncbi:hypothetical protein [Streptomyces lydicamycinicus]
MPARLLSIPAVAAAPSTASSLPVICLSSTSVPDQAGPVYECPR